MTSVFEGSDGNIFVTTQRWGIHRFNGERFTAVRPALPAGITYPGWGWGQLAFQDRNAEWWYATGQGLARYGRVSRFEDLGRTPPKRVYTGRDGLPGDNVFRIFQDSRGDIWIATIGAGQEGLSRWERATGRFRREPLIVGQSAVTAIAEDGAHHVWAGFYGGGLGRYREDTLDSFPPGSDMPSGLVAQILPTPGKLWVATWDHGLVRVDDLGAPHPSFRTYGRLAKGSWKTMHSPVV